MVESREGANRCDGDGSGRSCVGGEAGIQASQLFRWRQQLHGSPRPASLALAVTTDAAPIAALSSPLTPGVIEVEFATGTGAMDESW
jgi:transposase-like protein